MRREVQEGLGILAIAAVVNAIPAMLMGDSFAAVQFAFAFTFLFVLPLIPWVLLLERPLFERFALAVVLGISGIPIIFFMIGVVHGPLNLAVFLGIPLLVFVVGCFMLRRKMKRAPVVHHHTPPSAPATPPVQPPSP